jgi:predicted nucleic acid-binding protein
MAQRTVLLDTSVIVALENRSDPHHEKAKSLDRELLEEAATVVLHWGIVFEIADGDARVGRRAKGIQLLEQFEQGYSIFPINEPLYHEAIALYRGRPDKDWSLTDCASFVLMQREGIDEALTADVHFRQAGFKALLLD